MNAAPVRDETSSANDYRLFLHVEDEQDVVNRVADQLASWLRVKKGWSPRLDRNEFATDGARDLLTIHRDSSDGIEFRARLTEQTGRGVWRTQLTVQQPRAGQSWVALTVTNSEGRWVAVPGLANYLLESLRLADGATVLSRETRVVNPAGVDELLDEICDPDRQGLYLVAGSRHDDIDFKSFTSQVERWSRQVKGLAQVVVLTPEATEAVRDGLGTDHYVRPWTLRTFYPDVDPAIAADGLRHRYLTRQRLVDEPDDAIQRLLGRIARRHAALMPTPMTYLTADRALRRHEDKLLVEAIWGQLDDLVPATTDEPNLPASPVALPDEVPVTSRPTEEIDRYHDLLELVRKSLGVTEVTAAALDDIAARAQHSAQVTASVEKFSSLLADRQGEVDALKVELESARDLYEAMQLDERIASERASKLEDEARYLRSRLAEGGDHASAHGLVPAHAYTSYPSDFDDLHSRMQELEPLGVHFTGNPALMLGLDEHDTLGKLVTTTWDVLLVLADYLRARTEGDCEANVKQYLLNTPRGYRAIAPGKFGEGETKATMERWGGERQFAVPKRVHPSGRVTMEAHFKLGRVGMVSPRLYYLDCFSTSAEVFVGYVGPHLTNTQS